MDLLQFQRKYLSPKIKLLGDILGEVIVQQEGEEMLALEERIRGLAKQFREENDLQALEDLEKIINQLSMRERTAMIQAFSLFFQLANLAEEDYKIAVNDKRVETANDTLK